MINNKLSKILIFASIFIFAMVGSASADSWTEDDFELVDSSTMHKFGIDMTMESVGDDVKWTINLSDVGDITESGAQLVICNDNTEDSFLVGWSPESQAHYKEYDGGWSTAMNVPANMNVEKSADGKQFEITVPKSTLGDVGEKFGWAMNVEADTGYTGGSDQQHFPIGWDRWTVGENCYEDTVPKEPQTHDHWAGVPTANPVLLVGVLGIALVLFMRRQQK